MIRSLAVVYRGGTCGQFVRNVLYSVITETYQDLQFSKYGSAHHVHLLKKSFNVLDPIPLNRSLESTQTHAFTDIPELVSKYDRVVAITLTPNNKEEFIIRNINLLLKFYLEKQVADINPSPQLRRNLLSYLGFKYVDLVDKLCESKYDEEYKDICLYFLYKDLFSTNDYLLDLEKETEGPTDGAIELPFKCIIDGDTNAFVDFIERAVGDPLSDRQKEYARAMFERYYSSQNLLLFKHPEVFIEHTKAKALVKLAILKQEYDQ